MDLSQYQALFEQYLSSKKNQSEPRGLYEPVDYILSLGGKRMRPVLVLMANQLAGGNMLDALPAACSVEIFHNFTLLHDDIMDQAEVRRGKPTVHKKWDVNTGILSGDVMMIQAFECLESYDGDLFKELTKLLTRTSIEVCEGQQYDVDFESRTSVGEDEYLEMIKLKTSVLVACALKMGALIAGKDQNYSNVLYNFGLHLGLAFQLQDDYLDSFGNQETFGKRIGGDIVESKKTFLYIKALNESNEEQRSELLRLYADVSIDEEKKIEKVKTLFEQTGAVDLIQKEIEHQTQLALEELKLLDGEEAAQFALRKFADYLMNRKV